MESLVFVLCGGPPWLRTIWFLLLFPATLMLDIIVIFRPLVSFRKGMLLPLGVWFLRSVLFPRDPRDPVINPGADDSGGFLSYSLSYSLRLQTVGGNTVRFAQMMARRVGGFLSYIGVCTSCVVDPLYAFGTWQ